MTLLLAACGGEPEVAEQPDPIRPVKTVLVGEAAAGGVRNFPPGSLQRSGRMWPSECPERWPS